MHFLPRPGGSGEDDGVLVTIVFDGHKEQVIFITTTMIFIIIIVLSLSYGSMMISMRSGRPIQQ